MNDIQHTNIIFHLDPSIDQINELIDQLEHVTLLYIYSPDCKACQEVKPVLNRVREEYTGQLTIATVNAQAMPDVWEAFAINTLPSFLLVGGGQAISECSGIVDFESLLRLIEGAQRAMREGAQSA